ncbi:hypothetical protein XP1712_22545, partial [Xanthomonas perforans]
MNWPNVPWKKAAAIGGAVMINVVNTSPNPPCCSAMLLMPSPVNPFIAHLATKAAPTAPTTLVAKLTVKVNTDNENTVPNPYSSHLLNNDFV